MIGGAMPSLKALRAFEACARHLSVKAAAEELCVTPGAVSQMLKSLESDLGVRLFQRAHRGIFLTEAGRDYLPPIRNALTQITEAGVRLRASMDAGRLTLSTTLFFASHWLVPRLKAFQEAHPHIDLQVVTGKALSDFARDGVDVAIRHGLGHYRGLHSERVLAVELMAVAAPELARQYAVPVSPADLASWPQVHDAERRDWHLWLRAQGVDAIGPPRGPAFDDSSLLLKAVLAGHGAGLLPASLVAPDVAAGRLVKLAEVAWPEAFAYYLVYPEARHDEQKIAAFRRWILATAREWHG